MATVNRAYQQRVERDVAVKVIHQAIGRSDEAVIRFHREARLIAYTMGYRAVERASLNRLTMISWLTFDPHSKEFERGSSQ
jgi:hypothetical protein